MGKWDAWYGKRAVYVFILYFLYGYLLDAAFHLGSDDSPDTISTIIQWCSRELTISGCTKEQTVED